MIHQHIRELEGQGITYPLTGLILNRLWWNLGEVIATTKRWTDYILASDNGTDNGEMGHGKNRTASEGI